MLATIIGLGIALSGAVDCNGNGIDDAIDRAGVTPVGYWRFEANAGPFLDSGPNGLDGSGTNAVPIADVAVDTVPRTTEPNVTASLLGGDGYVTVPDTGGRLSFGGESFTVEAWVRVDELSDTSGSNQRQFLLQKKGLAAPGSTQDYSILVQGGNVFQSVSQNFGKTSGFTGRELVLLFGNGSTVWSVTSFIQIWNTGWHHVSVAYDGATGDVRFGLNGFFQTLESSGPGHTSNPGPLLIGAHTNNSGGYNQFLRGAVDELRITEGVVPEDQLLRSHDFADCNGNGVLDVCDIAEGFSSDCDGDGQPDECDLVGNDCDGNGIPDQCDPDCNDNGIADGCDIAAGTSSDCQPDGIPDECQLQDAFGLFYDSGFARIVWRADVPYMAWLNQFNVEDGAGLVEGIEVLWGIMPIGTEVGVYVWTDPNGDGNPFDAQVLWASTAIVEQTDTRSVIPVPDVQVGGTGASFFVGFTVPVTDQDFPAALDIEGVPGAERSWGIGWETPIDPNDLLSGAAEFGTINDLLFGNQWIIRARMRGDGTDCNANGIPDDCDIELGTSVDIDGNGIPDECDLDCNGNGLLDGFDIAGGTSMDCNGDAVPDECQLAANDCNNDGIPDDCQLDGNDCNGNGIPDSCDIGSGYDTDANGSGVPDECEDCNGNGVLDSVDISSEENSDCNGDGIPDECQYGEPIASTTYAYDDGVQESNLCFVGGSDLEFAWMNRFVVEQGAEWISAIEVVWGRTYPDLPAKVVLWSDPNGDGIPDDAQVIRTVETVSQKIDNPGDNRNVVPIPPTWIGPAGTSFFVGVNFFDIYGSGCFIALDVDDPVSGEGWYAYNTVGFLDLDNLSASILAPWDFANFLIRAVGFEGALANDCNANLIIDACDIAAGTSEDTNANGIPDECECIGDVDADGSVGFNDLLGVLAEWGACTDCPQDLDGSGSVDFNDLLLLLAAWGGC